MKQALKINSCHGIHSLQLGRLGNLLSQFGVFAAKLYCELFYIALLLLFVPSDCRYYTINGEEEIFQWIFAG